MNGRIIIVISLLMFFCGCSQNTASKRVVLYCSQDREYAEGIIADYTKTTGVQVDLRCDTEANKSVSLYEALVREAGQPRCDVFWCNEPVLMERLSQRGMLAPYDSASARGYPAWTRSKEGTWQAFAARARVFIVNNKLNDAETPKSLEELTEPKWHKKFAMAKPFYGTTATHMACLWQLLGKEKAETIISKLAANAVVLPGNLDVAKAVADGSFNLGLTDTDDAIVMVDKKAPVRLVYADQDKIGTLFLPNTIALIKGAPHDEEAKKLIDHLLSAEVERRLAIGPSAQIPLNPNVSQEGLKTSTPKTVRAMEVEYGMVAKEWEAVQAFLRKTFRD